MKKPLVMVMSLAVLLVSGCVDREAEARKVKAEAEAKARAEAARKEMDTMPQAFKPRDYLKRNEPDKTTEPEKKPDSNSKESKSKP